VERIGNLNYPEAAKGRLYGNLLLTVVIRADGNLERVDVERSSGHKVLDDAARRIVQMAAPYAGFPEAIRRDTDILEISRTWSFTTADRLHSD
jgi:protein TonB